MNINAINSLSSLFQNQGISNGPRVDRDGDNDGSGVNGIKGGRHQRGGGAFVQDVIQTLQSMGFNFPTQTVNPTSSASASNTGQNGNSSTSSSDPRQALHQLMHDIRLALKQSGTQQTGTAANAANSSDSDGDNDGSGSVQNKGYSDFATNLQNLINTLSNNSATTGSAPTNDMSGKLQSDFSNLVQALNNANAGANGSSGADSNTPTLLDFLNKLKENLPTDGGNQNAMKGAFQAIA